MKKETGQRLRHELRRASIAGYGPIRRPTAEYNRCRTGPIWREAGRGRLTVYFSRTSWVYDVFGGSPDAALTKRCANACERSAAVDPGDGYCDENLGFGVTSNLSYEPPIPSLGGCRRSTI